MNILEVNNLQKVYKSRFSASEVEALQDVTFSVAPGEFVAIMGESGSGKTTLLNILATLDTPTSGEVLINGTLSIRIRGKDLSNFRRNHLGFVFQDFSLLDTFTNEDNILLPLVLNKEKYRPMQEKLHKVARALNITDILKKYPYEISGGQKQRIAAARALITEPELLLADEPTGALDSRSSGNLLELFGEIHQAGQSIIMVTHSAEAASHAGRVLFLRDGEVYHQLSREGRSREEQYRRIVQALTELAQGGARYA